MLPFLWKATRGYRFHPWDSPYLKWRIETYWGLHAETMTAGEVLSFTWRQRAELRRFLEWAARTSS